MASSSSRVSPSSFSRFPPEFNLGAAYANGLNNAGVSLIKKGRYDRAITLLQQALRLSEFHIMNENEMTGRKHYCMCDDCTLNGCIAFSEQQSHHHDNSDIPINAPNPCNKRKRSTSYDDDNGGTSTCNNELGYIYQRPILIPNNHEMDATRFFLILFNIALAHHLKALSMRRDKCERYSGLVRKTLVVYELIFEYWARLQEASKQITIIEGDEDAPPSSSCRYVMIIYNNLSQMYQLVNDTKRERQCLQQLLSIVMIDIEHKTRNTGSSSFAPRRRTTIDSGILGINRDFGDNESDPFQESLDGFLANTAALTSSQQQCAHAA